ncbi:hypothetical protein CROQUDRAFT_49650 [Cronartium quercuum f. sp. fusiforme G11]|uniref:Uncharacterized protein n=1 Tax=Cronartium quercuum f. sp. fusiforme G11 TaxID=708437 RepID=A0A9P6NFU2_9BASI|nr:hypothetical protein CROQUDRAFT_49650 [Cronartium quercuum f. sp. fusiforme G11]
MRDVVMPTGITQLPSNLGQSNHGKLKAIQWHSMFAYLIPLLILELYIIDVDNIVPESNRGQTLLNISYLCQCTNIVCAKKVSENDAKLFEMFYKKYTETLKTIFPEAKINPNHHYALHLGQQLRQWGPLYQVAEFHGEQLVGVLQQYFLSTNMVLGVVAQMDKTMMLRFNQLQWLTGSNTIYEEILDQNDPKETGSQKNIRNLIELEETEYENLLSYVKLTSPSTQDHRNLPHPKGSLVLHPYVTPKLRMQVSEYVLVSVLKPNNCVQYKESGQTLYGLVQQIFEFKQPNGRHEVVFLINPINNLFPKDLQSPSKWFRYILFLLKVVVGQIDDEFLYLAPKCVCSTAAYRLLSSNVFGIPEGGIILQPYDYDSQLELLT